MKSQHKEREELDGEAGAKTGRRVEAEREKKKCHNAHEDQKCLRGVWASWRAGINLSSAYKCVERRTEE